MLCLTPFSKIFHFPFSCVRYSAASRVERVTGDGPCSVWTTTSSRSMRCTAWTRSDLQTWRAVTPTPVNRPGSLGNGRRWEPEKQWRIPTTDLWDLNCFLCTVNALLFEKDCTREISRVSCVKYSCYFLPVISPLLQCSASCGQGYRQRPISCSEVPVENDNYEYGHQSLSNCQGTPPEIYMPCNLDPCPAPQEWKVGIWGPVSESIFLMLSSHGHQCDVQAEHARVWSDATIINGSQTNTS